MLVIRFGYIVRSLKMCRAGVFCFEEIFMNILGSIKSLTKFEWALWICSVLTVVTAFVFSGDVLNLVASLIGVTALIFVAKGLVLGQVLTVVFSIFYGIISFELRYYGEMITYLGMTAPIALAAVFSWLRHPFKETAQVEVSRLSAKQKAVLGIGAAVVTVAFYFILKAMGNSSLIPSTVSVTTSFLASGLTFFRSPYYALGYSANDVVLIVLWVIASMEDISYLPMVFCFVAFLANDLYGFFNWKRIEKTQQKD